MAMLQQNDGRIEDPSIVDNEFLDEITIHFGEWIKQMVDWTDQNLVWLLDAIKWPFSSLFELLMSDDPSRTAIMDIPWYWVAILFFVIGSIARNTRVGVMVGVMVAVCGLLGPDYWSETTKTFGMVFISVLLCAIIGIPLGVLSGRVDAIWNVVRPTLDAMQVVHSFVYMLPFIFFFGIGEVAATMVTMVFALPPIVRLTNLGIRQVPSDVVEASRAFGSSEPRVLMDVQLPLARPAIMTGLNQTLLLAISMLGIAAIMGAANLGTLLLRAISSQNLPLAASGGLAFFLVAVVLDRISQREIDDGQNLLVRMRQAMAYRRNPDQLEDLLRSETDKRAAVEAADSEVQATETTEPAERPAPMGSVERIGLALAALGGIGAIVSTLLPWGSDAGLIAAWGRSADEKGVIGQSFMGIEASGGNIFGVAVLLFGSLAVAAAIRPWFNFGGGLSRTINRVLYVLFGILGAIAILVWGLNMAGSGFGPLPRLAIAIFGVVAVLVALDTWVRGTPRLGADGAVIASLGALGAAVGYFMTQTSPFTEQYSHEFGIYVALGASALAAIGGLIAMTSAPYVPQRPLSLSLSAGTIIGAALAVGLLFVGSYSAWMIDSRLEGLITPEIQAEIDRLREEAGNDINLQIANGQAITNLINNAKAAAAPNYFGFLDNDSSSELRNTVGPGLGWPTMGFGVLAALAALATSGLLGRRNGLIWRAGTVASGLALGALVIPLSWVLSFTRSAEPAAITAAGAAFAAIGGFVLFAIGQGAIKEFRRRKIYADVSGSKSVVLDEEPSPLADEELVGANA